MARVTRQLDQRLMRVDERRRGPQCATPVSDPPDANMQYTQATSPNRPPQQHTMPPDEKSPSPRQDSPAKTAAEQKLKKLRRTDSILTWAAFVCLGFSMVAIRLLSNSVWGIVVVSVTGASFLAVVTSTVRVWIHERKSRMITNACRTCEYDLTGLDQPKVCPECGTPISHPSDSTLP